MNNDNYSLIKIIIVMIQLLLTLLGFIIGVETDGV